MTIAAFTFYAVIVGWFGFAGAMLTAMGRRRQAVRRRERSALPGLILQMLGYSLVWAVRRAWRAPLLVQTVAPQLLLCVLALALMIVFTLAVAAAWARGLDFRCGCFGKIGAAGIGARKFAENVVLTLIAALAVRRERG